MAKNKLIVSNWKMNLNLSDSKKLINKLISKSFDNQNLKLKKITYFVTYFTRILRMPDSEHLGTEGTGGNTYKFT